MEKVKKTTFFTAKNITYFAVLVALVVVLQMFGGYIQISGVSLNLALVPIALGAILFGAGGGALLGLICGFIITMYGVTGTEAFTFYLFSVSPVVTVLLCLIKTTAAGAVAGLAYWLISKKNKIIAIFVTSALVPIVNTGIFAIGCFVIYEEILAYLSSFGLDYSGESAFYVVFVVIITWNFFIELLTSLLLAPAVASVTKIVEKQIAKNSKKKAKAAAHTEDAEASEIKENDNLS